MSCPQCRYHNVLFPVTNYVCELLPDTARDSSRVELYYEDLDKLQPEDVAHICEWLTEKVDSYSSRLHPEPKDVAEEVRFIASDLFL